MSSTLVQRKADHLALCATGEVGFRRQSALFEAVQLVHNALPELALHEIDLSCTLFGKPLRAPFVIASMTGGSAEAEQVNRTLASVAEVCGVAFGVGSQRAMHEQQGKASSYRVREVAPTTVVLGNIGLVQARKMPTLALAQLVESIGADALCVHLNPAMELVQPEGDCDFREGLTTLTRLVRELPVPIVVKETGCGLSPDVARRVQGCGVEHLDVSGAGGTSWVGVESKRAEEKGNAASHALGELLWDWGIPTAASVASIAPFGFRTLVATGGIASGLDAAKAIALGATTVGIARPLLQALYAGGKEAVVASIQSLEQSLRVTMLLTGSRTLHEMRSAPRMIAPSLRAWIDTLATGAVGPF